MNRVVLLSLLLLASAPTAAQECNIANILFGKVRVELLHHKDYDTGIIFGNDFDNDRFQYDKILGVVASSERDGSRAVRDVNQNSCGRIGKDLRITTDEYDCKSCARMPIKLQRVDSGFVVMSGSSIMGTVEGKLPQ